MYQWRNNERVVRQTQNKYRKRKLMWEQKSVVQ
jgi:hypothetical protein